MGKEKPAGKSEKKKLRHAPLGKQIQDDQVLDPSQRKQRLKQRIKARNDEEEEETKITPVSAKATKAILKQAKKQREELSDEDADVQATTKPVIPGPRAPDSDEEWESEYSEDEDHYLDDVEEVTAEDEAALAMFMNPMQQGPRTIGDILMDKVRERGVTSGPTIGDTNVSRLDPRFADVYKNVAKVLHIYRSGKLPKAFKIIPALTNWEEVLYLTQPDEWSDQAMMAATKLFASNLNAKMAQRFYNLVLLPRVRDQIEQTHKLSFHLYMSLKMSLFKPSAFFKGILLPLCESGSCTLREALIVGSVLAKVSIPFQHSGAALLKLGQLEYTPANSVFMRILLNKKYSMAFRVIDETVNHFMRFMGEKRALPVLWHQCLLVFVQRYKNDLTEEQNDALRTLTHAQRHPLITPDIQRELHHATFRGQQMLPENMITERLYTGTGSAMDAMMEM